MYYKTKVQDFIRVPPSSFEEDTEQAITQEIKKKYNGYIHPEMGFVIDVSEINNIGEGIILPGDGSAHYKVEFTLLTFKPEMQEIVIGKITNVADFGAFMNIGPVEGMIHISQTMNDFVSFSKDGVLLGKNTKHTLKSGDICKARIIAVSYKDLQNPKIGLTMRQPGLGKEEWILEETKSPEKEDKKGST
ncbi:MAG: DNA-directed RNA polymerase [Candidatus Woesearchaeota archaeon]|nr:MAG: DNA-directed RNA polymerase [Candidatus Woesearchaeota archaeon]